MSCLHLCSHRSLCLNCPSLLPPMQLSSKDFLVVQWLRRHATNTGGPGSIPGQGTRSCMAQLKIPCATTKTWCSQINKYRKMQSYKKNKVGQHPTTFPGLLMIPWFLCLERASISDKILLILNQSLVKGFLLVFPNDPGFPGGRVGKNTHPMQEM